MKEPKNHRPFEVEQGGIYTEYCAADGDEWPCKKWRRWTASKDYRLGELEDKHELLASAYRLTEKELRETKEKLRRLELLVRGGVLRSLADKGRGQITETVTREPVDVGPTLIAGPEEYTVAYTSPNGSTYENNELIETWSP